MKRQIQPLPAGRRASGTAPSRGVLPAQWPGTRPETWNLCAATPPNSESSRPSRARDDICHLRALARGARERSPSVARACRTTTEPLDGGRLTMGAPHQSGGTASSARYRSAGAEGTTKVHFGTAQLVQLHQGACGVNQGDSPVGPSDDDVLVDAARSGSVSDFGSPGSDPIAGSRC